MYPKGEKKKPDLMRQCLCSQEYQIKSNVELPAVNKKLFKWMWK
jgi:hypothetical protein